MSRVVSIGPPEGLWQSDPCATKRKHRCKLLFVSYGPVKKVHLWRETVRHRAYTLRSLGVRERIVVYLR